MEPCRYVIKFAFDGRLFSGYARQPEGGTVEDELLEALHRADIIQDSREAAFSSSSRVDRGVSAIGAAAAFDATVGMERVLRPLNAHTTRLVAHSIAQVDPGYDPRRRASSRLYRYHFRQEDDLGGLDVPAMRVAAHEFLGEHDFSAFARLDGRNPRRSIADISVERRSGALVLDVRGRSFLWNQIRRMASAIRMVGTGETRVAELRAALHDGEGGPFPPLPSHGLFLMDVAYDDLEFLKTQDYPKGALGRLREGYHQELCSVRYYEYLRESVPF
jgi:tRNA pseudouridine38-40 synthase